MANLKEAALDGLSDVVDWGSLGEAEGFDAAAGFDDAGETEENTLVGVDVEGEAKAEISEALRAFKDAANKEDNRFFNNTDSEFWCCLIFQNRLQKEEFLRKMGWYDLGDKYIDGVEIAERAGLTFDIPPMPVFSETAKLATMAADIGAPMSESSAARSAGAALSAGGDFVDTDDWTPAGGEF